MKPGNLQMQGAKSGGANRKMRLLVSDAFRLWRNAFLMNIV